MATKLRRPLSCGERVSCCTFTLPTATRLRTGGGVRGGGAGLGVATSAGAGGWSAASLARAARDAARFRPATSAITARRTQSACFFSSNEKSCHFTQPVL